MFFEEGKAWGRSRRLIAPNLNGHNVAAMLPVISKVTVTQCFSFFSGNGDAAPLVRPELRRGRGFFACCFLVAPGLHLSICALLLVRAFFFVTCRTAVHHRAPPCTPVPFLTPDT